MIRKLWRPAPPLADSCLRAEGQRAMAAVTALSILTKIKTLVRWRFEQYIAKDVAKSAYP
jgi:hypothetical protein